MEKKRTSDSSNTNSGKRQKKQEDEDQKAIVSAKTYLQQLPDLVVYQILQLLPIKFATRAIFLSKQWAQIWSSLNVEVLHEKDCLSDDPTGRKKFLAHMRSRLQWLERSNHGLNKLILHMRYPGGTKTLDKWIDLAAKRDVRELDICLRTTFGAYDIYKFSVTVFNAKSLTILSLENVKIRFDDSTAPIRFPSLKTMSLKKMHDLGVFHLINSWCPSLECLSLASFKNFSDVKISCPSLKSLEVIGCENTLIRATAVKSIESVKFNSTYWYHFHTDLVFPVIRNLELVSVILDSSGKWWPSLHSIFPLLESLIFHECESFPLHISISHTHLKLLEFHKCKTKYVKTVAINTPNLLSFALISGTVGDSENFLSNFCLTAPNLSEAKINLNFQLPWTLPILTSFFQNFDCAREISLLVNQAEALTSSEDMRNNYSPPLPCLKHLSVAITSAKRITHLSLIKDTLLWMAPSLKVLSVKHNGTDVLYEKL